MAWLTGYNFQLKTPKYHSLNDYAPCMWKKTDLVAMLKRIKTLKKNGDNYIAPTRNKTEVLLESVIVVQTTFSAKLAC
jgi:hypothetical protein